MSPIALYIHWPFCKKKCPYCDFNSHVREEIDVVRWQTGLLTELEWMINALQGSVNDCGSPEQHAPSASSVDDFLTKHTPNPMLSSIFFGGGTPSLMPPDIAAKLIEQTKRLSNASSNDQIEITLEANPTSVEAQRFAEFQQAGINRVSLGVQSLNDNSLRFLGREHSAKEALQAVELAQSLFTRTSFDMIYALPEQPLQSWEKELHEALQYTRGHMSLYQLTIEQGTAFHHAYHSKCAFALPVDDDAANLYELTNAIMHDAGMPAYEISNYAAEDQQCRHNLTYWRGQSYMGIGPGAHGRLQDTRGNWVATATIKSPERWLEAVEQHGHGLEVHEIIEPRARLEEQLMMGLRLTEGMPLSSDSPLHSILQHDQLDLLCHQGHLHYNGEQLIVPAPSMLLLNKIVALLLV